MVFLFLFFLLSIVYIATHNALHKRLLKIF